MIFFLEFQAGTREWNEIFTVGAQRCGEGLLYPIWQTVLLQSMDSYLDNQFVWIFLGHVET